MCTGSVLRVLLYGSLRASQTSGDCRNHVAASRGKVRTPLCRIQCPDTVVQHELLTVISLSWRQLGNPLAVWYSGCWGSGFSTQCFALGLAASW